ncbi:protein-methionine-sulfoxide reductase heme-binding subunit MsrQ [Acetobacter thailandicus]|uniref:sulfite oxidase heme-binding subunit YedZ n=1 Tax=Acetobacter thailandicus TaxID=1502842 RepID=UPI001BA705A3|nr:protein-methionine-sulfoxide reductase heme-binding subunit MsrQ [Acetobacter thailandicus]MBS0984782.1 sulfoxide reductase heme-binding subunit YedZ [Acetobacter thailandicus]
MSGRSVSSRQKNGFTPVKRQVLLYLFFLAPFVFDLTAGVMGNLGPDPAHNCLHDFGRYAIRFLLLSLAITPLKRFAGVDLMLWRRPLGLLAFTYAALHIFFYVVVIRHVDTHVLWRDVTTRPFLIFGLLTFLILLPLALTSTRKTIKALGRWWRPLHRLVYGAAILASIHYMIAFKTWHVQPFVYAALVCIFLSFRLVRKGRTPRRA